MAGYVSQDALRVAVIGLVAIVAISMAAASITVAVQPGGVSGPSDPGPPGENNNQGDQGDEESGEASTGEGGEEGTSVQISNCIRFLDGPIGTIGYFGLFGAVLYGLKRRYNFGTALLGMYALSPFVLVAYFVNTTCATAGGPGLGDGGGSGPVDDLANTGIASPEISPIVLIGVMGLVVVVAGVVLYRASGDQAVLPEEADEDELEQPDVADLAAAAGRAADRMEEHNVDVDNEVYRAWWQMTQLLNVPDPDTSTPGDFADAAVEAGLNRADVDALTTLFEEVRYGKRDPERREERAIEVFRDIEAEYGESSGDDGGPGGSTADGKTGGSTADGGEDR